MMHSPRMQLQVAHHSHRLVPAIITSKGPITSSSHVLKPSCRNLNRQSIPVAFSPLFARASRLKTIPTFFYLPLFSGVVPYLYPPELRGAPLTRASPTRQNSMSRCESSIEREDSTFSVIFSQIWLLKLQFIHCAIARLNY